MWLDIFNRQSVVVWRWGGTVLHRSCESGWTHFTPSIWSIITLSPQMTSINISLSMLPGSNGGELLNRSLRLVSRPKFERLQFNYPIADRFLKHLFEHVSWLGCPSLLWVTASHYNPHQDCSSNPRFFLRVPQTSPQSPKLKSFLAPNHTVISPFHSVKTNLHPIWFTLMGLSVNSMRVCVAGVW